MPISSDSRFKIVGAISEYSAAARAEGELAGHYGACGKMSQPATDVEGVEIAIPRKCGDGWDCDEAKRIKTKLEGER